jgi:hypothetical protein
MEESQNALKMQKLEKQLEETFVDEVRAASNENLMDRVINLSKEVEDNQNDKKNDGKLNSLKDDVKALAGGYNDLIKDKKKRIQLILLLLEERGKL